MVEKGPYVGFEEEVGYMLAVKRRYHVVGVLVRFACQSMYAFVLAS